jgi:hypothetical protein
MKPQVAIVGAGPAGLIAADHLSAAGATVTLYERMPSPARKLLMAGRGGLNLTHGEARDTFLDRYREARDRLAPVIDAFDPDALRQWCRDLGIETFVGSSGRVFPSAMKASPLLRALLARLAARTVELRLRWHLTGIDAGRRLVFDTPDGVRHVEADAVLLALGGASWPRLGSDGGWTGILAAHGVGLVPFSPANAGVGIAWTAHLRDRFAGTPLKRICLTVGGRTVAGEAMITGTGLEGGAVYALSPEIRRELADAGKARLVVDLRPDLDRDDLAGRLARPRGKQSLSSHLRKAAGLAPVAVALLAEAGDRSRDTERLAARIKALPLEATGFAGIERAISSAGGIAWEAVDAGFMLKALPGVHVAGEMLDWEAPTGGYLLQACFSTGLAAARGIAAGLGLAPDTGS